MLIAGREDPTLDLSKLREPNRLAGRVPFVPLALRAGLRVLWPCVMLALVTSGFSCWETDTQAPAEPQPNRSEMEVVVVPSVIAVPPDWDGTFSVQVLARDLAGNVVRPGDAVVNWAGMSELVSVDAAGWLTRLRVRPSEPSEIRLEASISGVPGQGTLTLQRSAEAAGDEVRAAHAEGDLVEVLLAAGAGVDGACVDEAYGFVGRASIPNVKAGAAACRDEAVLFSSSQRAVRSSPAGWTGGTVVLGAAASTGSQTYTPLDGRPTIGLRVYVMCQPSAACPPLPGDDLTRIQGQVDFAIASFEFNRVGVTLTLQEVTALQYDSNLADCSSAAEKLMQPGLAPSAGGVVVLVMRSLSEARAVTCNPDPETGVDAAHALILMAAEEQWDQAVLAHELGHVLGLKDPPPWGHVYRLGASVQPLTGIGRDNLMAETTDAFTYERFRFTLGQVYRMNFDSRGLLPAAGKQAPLSVPCGCNPLAAQTCPPLVRDLKPMQPGNPNWTGPCPGS